MKSDNWKRDHDLKAVLTKIGEDYEILKYLGGGGFSKVYLVRHVNFGEGRALIIMDCSFILQKIEKQKKKIKDIKKEYNKTKERFINEARLYKKIKHTNIVEIFDVSLVSDKDKGIGIPYLIMPYIKGLSLNERLSGGAPLALQTVFRISEDILSALDTIHQKGVIHRDIKPANIMIEEKTGAAILIDFGLAKDVLSETKLTTTGMHMGTPTYMSPEQFKSSKDLTPRSDIYSFGIVLFEMLTGEPPFKDDDFLKIMEGHCKKTVPDVRKKNPNLPAGIEKIIFKSMAKEPGDRYSNAMEFLNAFRELKEPPRVIEKKEKIRKDSIKRYPTVKYLTDKYSIKKGRYFVYLLLAIALFAFIVLNPLGVGKEKERKRVEPLSIVDLQYKNHIDSVKKYIRSGEYEKASNSLNKAKKIKDTDEIKQLQETIATKEREDMSKNFEVLKAFLKKDAPENEKLKKCREFLNKHQSVPQDKKTTLMVSQINEKIDQLETGIRADAQYKACIDDVKKSIEIGDFQKAANTLKKAKDIKDTEEIKKLSETIENGLKDERINGTKEYESIERRMNLKRYLAFKKKYPDSVYIPDLKRRLEKADKRLPPEEYWEKPIKKNEKGYYQLTFDEEHNEHLMIYIPEKKIWMDKYEVSWRQFRRFAKAQGIQLPHRKDTKYIKNGNEFPAVVSYQNAQQYCKKYGFRLPKEDEWEYIAGKGRFKYPWGNKMPDEDGICRANFDSYDGTAEKDGFDGTAPVKSLELFSSPFDVVNMAGNVKEWVQGKILKGGGFFSEKEDLIIKKSRIGGRNVKEGFRCIKEEN